MDDELKEEIKKMALQNAFEHGGETRDKIILGKDSWEQNQNFEVK